MVIRRFEYYPKGDTRKHAEGEREGLVERLGEGLGDRLETRSTSHRLSYLAIQVQHVKPAIQRDENSPLQPARQHSKANSTTSFPYTTNPHPLVENKDRTLGGTIPHPNTSTTRNRHTPNQSDEATMFGPLTTSQPQLFPPQRIAEMIYGYLRWEREMKRIHIITQMEQETPRLVPPIHRPGFRDT